MSAVFDNLQYLRVQRLSSAAVLKSLLWENIESNDRWDVQYAGLDISQDWKKAKYQIDCYHPAFAGWLLSFSGTVDLLEQGTTKEILLYGAVRRSFSIQRSMNKFCEIAHPLRKNPLSIDEAGLLTDALTLIYVHIIGILDAFAICLCRLSQLGDDAERKSDLLQKKFRENVGVSGLDGIFAENDECLKRWKDTLRNRFVHRVPPYIPMAQYSSKQASEVRRLDRLQWEAAYAGKRDEAKEYERQKFEVGSFSPWINFAESDFRMMLHPTVMDDVFRIFFLSSVILEELVGRLTFVAR